MDELEAEIHLIEEHWREIGIQNGWSKEKFEKLAKRLNLTPLRLAMLFGLKRYEFNNMIAKGKVTRVVALHCAMLESYLDAKTQTLIPFEVFQ